MFLNSLLPVSVNWMKWCVLSSCMLLCSSNRANVLRGDFGMVIHRRPPVTTIFQSIMTMLSVSGCCVRLPSNSGLLGDSTSYILLIFLASRSYYNALTWFLIAKIRNLSGMLATNRNIRFCSKQIIYFEMRRVALLVPLISQYRNNPQIEMTASLRNLEKNCKMPTVTWK